MASTVHVKGISHSTSEKEVREFFSFCGKISSLDVKDEREGHESPKEATVVFEKDTAAKTALLLDNTMLGAAEVHVTAGKSSGSTGSTGTSTGTTSSSTGSSTANTSTSKSAGTIEDSQGELEQEDKPRSRIIAEYLAQGYVVGDKAIEQALHLDQQHGISTRFQNALQQFDQRTKATDKAAAIDDKYNITARATDAWKGLASYFEKAADTPTGQRIRNFYEQGQKQVLDVHNEARHLADLKSGKDSSSSSTGVPSAEQADMKKVEIGGKERTKCNCGGNDGKCPCEKGTCACTGCSKSG